VSHQPTILYVEDDTLSREVMQIILTYQMGYQSVFIFEDSANFMARVEALPTIPDIILLDIHIRPYSGFEMLTMLRNSEAYRLVPVIALTASVMNEEIDELRHAGFNGVLSKPIDPDTFQHTWQLILQGQPVWNITQ
jgi:two-component system, cell cycle response regulator DivK